MKRLFIPFVLLMSLLLSSCGDEINYTPLNQEAVILAFGDSVTYGYNASKGADYPTQLESLINRKVINAGISGEKVLNGKNRIAEELQTHHPDLVIIEIGGNDFLARRNNREVKEDIRSVITAVKSKNIIPILVSVPNISPAAMIAGKPKDASLYKELAKEEKVLLVDSIFSNILSDENLRSDQIHPNDQGYALLAAEIAKKMREAGLL